MATLNAPSITIAFKEAAAASIERSTRGIVALILMDDTQQTFVVYDATDIPSGLSDANKQYISDALIGYQTMPTKIVVYVIATPDEGEDADYDAALDYLETVDFHYLAAPCAAADGKVADIITWIKAERALDKSCKYVAVNAADDDGIIDWESTLYRVAGTAIAPVYTTPRIAGILAGTSLTASATYAPLTDFVDCIRLTKAEQDTAVGAGKLIAFWDGEKVKLSRAVNSFVTTTSDKGDSFKKIRLVEIMDMMRADIRRTIQDSYIGKYINSYDNKCLLITAINAYFQTLVTEGALLGGSCDIDMSAQRNYLTGKGIDISGMTSQEIREANTGSNVFLEATVSLADVFEDITFNIAV